jgi:hypothetical protein
MKRTLLLAIAGLLLSGCMIPAQHADIRTAEGTLCYYPSDVKSREAWLGHNFIVGDTPVIPTATVTESALTVLAGKTVVVSGRWNSGRKWKPVAADEAIPMPIDRNTVIGDGIMIESISVKQ